MMTRTQIYLPEDLKQRIKLRAKKENKTEAEIIRDLLEQGFGKEKQLTGREALLGLAKLGEKLDFKGPPDLSSRIDDYLYGEKSD